MSDSPAAVLVDVNGTLVEVTEDGRLRVEQGSVRTPPGRTEVLETVGNTISRTSTTNFNIPVGETLVVQQFVAGAAGDGGKGARVILIYDQSGGGPIQDLEIARAYVGASTYVETIDFVAPRAAVAGDRIRIRRTPLEGSTQEIYSKFQGYY